MKRLPPKYEIEEQDLETEDHVLIQKFESETINPENLWWIPMFAAGDMSNHGSPDNFLFYALAFFTVAILVFERLAMQLGSRFLDWIRTVISRQSSLSLPRLRLDQIRALWQARALAWHTHQQPRNPKQYKPLNRRPIVCGPDTICHSQVHLPVWSSGTNRWNKNCEKDCELKFAMDEITKWKQTNQETLPATCRKPTKCRNRTMCSATSLA